QRRRRRRLADEHRLLGATPGGRARPLHGDAHVHGDRPMIAAASGVAAAALSVTPVRLRLTGSAARTIAITNTGDSPVVVRAQRAGRVIDGRGLPRLAGSPQPAESWIHMRPSRVTIAPGGRAVIAVSSTAPPTASFGDHPALVLLTTQPRPGAGVAVRVRIGVV